MDSGFLKAFNSGGTPWLHEGLSVVRVLQGVSMVFI